MKRKIAITTTTFGEYDDRPLKLLEDGGFEVAVNSFKRALQKDEIPVVCGGCEGIVAGTEEYDAETLKKLKGLKVISRVGVGLDSIDLKAADGLDIKVVNTPCGPVNAVAELTVGLILSLLRKTTSMDRGIRSGKWKKMMGNLLSGKRVGVVGYGRIGQRVAGLLAAFGCETAYCDPVVNSVSPGTRSMRLKDLLGWADVVTIHVSGKNKVIGEEELSCMKKGSWLINVSRGGIVDESALYAALKDGRLSGAAVDVFDREPYDGPLKELDNIILTPHVGSYAIESRVEMEMDAVKNLLNIIK